MEVNMGHGLYILGKDGKTPVLCESAAEWGRLFDREKRKVAFTQVGDINVSTVFLGLDHSYGDGTPILFETMIFGGEHDEYQNRCATWEGALKMHKKALALVRESIKRKGKKSGKT
jgi:hypothetical protein